jgi:hypothetical protein
MRKLETYTGHLVLFGHAAERKVIINAYIIFIRKPGKQLFGRLGRKWEDNITTDLTEISYEDGT